MKRDRFSVFSFKGVAETITTVGGGVVWVVYIPGRFPPDEAVITPGSCLALGNPDVGIAINSLAVVSSPVFHIYIPGGRELPTNTAYTMTSSEPPPAQLESATIANALQALHNLGQPGSIGLPALAQLASRTEADFSIEPSHGNEHEPQWQSAVRKQPGIVGAGVRHTSQWDYISTRNDTNELCASSRIY